jgi:DNA (cytosine-5)-methyltransferase 1
MAGMRIGSLFSGAGGLDMAVEAVFGGTTVWHAEIDKAASKVLAYRWPGVVNLGDVSEINWDSVPPVDVLCGGFPCQDVSAAGKRAGIKDGTRSGLWSVFAEAIDIIRPPWVVIENVRGLLSAEAHRNLEPELGTLGDGRSGPILRAAGAVLGDLADLGYDAQWATVAAADVGAPHRRERVFIVASYGEGEWMCPVCKRIIANCRCSTADSGGAAVGLNTGRTPSTQAGAHPGDRSGDHCGERADVALFPTPSACNANDGEGTETWLARREAVKARVKNGNGMGMPLSIAVQLLPTPQAHDSQGPKTPEQIATMRAKGFGVRNLNEAAVHELFPTPNASDASGGGQHPDKREGHSRQLIDYVLLCTPTAEPGTSRSGSRVDEPLLRKQAVEMSTAWGKYEPAIRRWEQLTRPAPPPTEPNKNGNPRLAAAFSEWLMGWPDGWVTDPAIGISRNDQLRIVGNGVCPQQAATALRYLLNVAEVSA